jgi:hypothetical protein
MLHRVLPYFSQQPRYCFSSWIGETAKLPWQVNRSAHALVRKPERLDVGGEQLWRYLLSPANRKHVFKSLYSHEWKQSIIEAHPDNSDRAAAIQKFEDDVATIRKVLGPGITTLQQHVATGNIESIQKHFHWLV